MADAVKMGKLLEAIRILGPIMTNEEISEMGLILIRVTNRLLKENKEEN